MKSISSSVLGQGAPNTAASSSSQSASTGGVASGAPISAVKFNGRGAANKIVKPVSPALAIRDQADMYVLQSSTTQKS